MLKHAFYSFTGFAGLRMHRAQPVPCCTAGFAAHLEAFRVSVQCIHTPTHKHTQRIWASTLFILDPLFKTPGIGLPCRMRRTASATSATFGAYGMLSSCRVGRADEDAVVTLDSDFCVAVEGFESDVATRLCRHRRKARELR